MAVTIDRPTTTATVDVEDKAVFHRPLKVSNNVITYADGMASVITRKRSLNVLFVNPPVPGYNRSMAKWMTFNTVPLALMYPATVLREAGHRVALCDVKSGEAFRISQSVDIVGITTDTTRYYNALKIAKYAKSLGKVVIMGGNHVSFQTKETLGTGYVDFIVRGEGEFGIVNLVNALSQLPDLRDLRQLDAKAIPGISWRDAYGEVVDNKPAPMIKDLNDLPIIRHKLLNLDLYRKGSANRFGRLAKPMFQISGSRGCPYDCSFCIVTATWGAKWRARSPESLVAEMEEGIKLGFDNFFFTDDLFTTNYHRGIELAELILKKGLKVTWSIQASCNSIGDHEDMVQIMGKAGLEAVLLGVESMNEDTLKLYRKKATVDDNFGAVRNLQKYDIAALASTIIGSPGETRESLESNFQYLVDLNPEMLWINILTPYVGTDDWGTYQDRIFDRNWEHYDVYHSVMWLDNLSPWEVEFAQKQMMARYYSRPKYLFGRLPKLF